MIEQEVLRFQSQKQQALKAQISELRTQNSELKQNLQQQQQQQQQQQSEQAVHKYAIQDENQSDQQDKTLNKIHNIESNYHPFIQAEFPIPPQDQLHISPHIMDAASQ